MKLSKSDLFPPIAHRFLQSIKRDFLQNGSTGLGQLDLRLIEAINPARGGYFVELGANDGLRQSNTYKLQKDFGWTGLLIEPSSTRFRECVVNRCFGNKPSVVCGACVPFDYSERFVEIEDSDLMSVAKGLDIADFDAVQHADQGSKFLFDPALRHSYGALAFTLTSILLDVGAPTGFDLLSLDVEGNELAVLRGLNFDRYRPKWILVEVREQSCIFDYLVSKGYVHVKDLGVNSVYSDCLFRDAIEPFNG